MKKFLPRTKYTPNGFTLVELLVVISIIAVLSVIGITIFSGVQKNARDARRRGDIDAIAKALEVNKTSNSQVYNVLSDPQFASGKIPVDSANNQATYCANTSTTVGAPPAAATTWANSAACPTGYTTISATNPAATTASWTLCAVLENGTNNIYCKSSAQ
ncbi:MAG: prepilin-type N-terminal cleavage/methylation domain-containing protein [Candidatus Daviesbacteria bacterium]|nr:prepilin-type N-terminal cleavage/methylation domain-containing protein [Candidatus Daviesbacteria bacterium]